jgi:hypothetical protein
MNIISASFRLLANAPWNPSSSSFTQCRKIVQKHSDSTMSVKNDAWEALLAGAVRRKIPMPVWLHPVQQRHQKIFLDQLESVSKWAYTVEEYVSQDPPQ